MFDEYECELVSCTLCSIEWTMAEEWSQLQCACPCIQITLKITHVYLIVLKTVIFCTFFPSDIEGSAISRVTPNPYSSHKKEDSQLSTSKYCSKRIGDEHQEILMSHCNN